MGETFDVEQFITHWRATGGSELANTQSFIKGLCRLIGVEPPHGSRTDDALNDYVFERRVFQDNGDGTVSFGRIDCYKRMSGLIPEKSFTNLLKNQRAAPQHLEHQLTALWAAMDAGDFSPALGVPLRKFNGYLFKDRTAIPLDAEELEVLIQAAEHRWTEVEPAIFGTLLERALNPKDLAKLGAHYTPRLCRAAGRAYDHRAAARRLGRGRRVPRVARLAAGFARAASRL